MWELYAMWTLIAAFFVAHFSAGAEPGTGAVAGEASYAAALALAGLAGFCVIALGGVGAVLAGAWADRWGRERVAIWAMATSGACALVAGWLIGSSTWILLPVALVWGFAIVADSAQFSALVTEVAPKHAVGTALTLQTSLGFALTALSIWLCVEVSSRVGWGPAFSLLAIGPALGIAAMLRLKRVRFEVPSRSATSGARQGLG